MCTSTEKYLHGYGTNVWGYFLKKQKSVISLVVDQVRSTYLGGWVTNNKKLLQSHKLDVWLIAFLLVWKITG
jgi:hypothetical protein